MAAFMFRSARLALVVAAASIGILLCPAVRAAGDAIQPFPPGQNAFGMTLQDWATAFMQWDNSLPNTGLPDSDPTGLQAGMGQHLPVWFLPSWFFGHSLTRTIIVPAGYGVMLAGPYNFALPPPGQFTDQQILDESTAGARMLLDKLTVFTVSVDGAALANLQQYRMPTPIFSLVLPPDNPFGITIVAGQDQRRAVAGEGYFMLFPSFPVGRHVIQMHVKGFDPNNNQAPFDDMLVYNLVVQEPNVPLP